MRDAASLTRTIRRHPWRWALAVVLVAGAIGFALYWFAPWNLIVDRRVDEALPTVTSDARDAPASTSGEGTGTGTEGTDDEPAVDAPARIALARGAFRGLEHATSGTALLVQLADGSRFLRLEDLETSNGPDLRVIVTDRPLSQDWHVWDDGEYVDLGPLKGNLGSSNYRIPADLDLSGFRTAVIWCRRFSVGFGVAPLAAVPG
jgi:hypothetical protein